MKEAVSRLLCREFKRQTCGRPWIPTRYPQLTNPNMSAKSAAKKILIVDDEEDIVNLVRLILEDAGYQVTSCTNGVEALERLGKENFDLILLDIMMPMLSGWEVLREL